MKSFLKPFFYTSVLSLALVSCREANEADDLDQLRAEGADVKVSDDGQKVKIKTDDKKIKIKTDDDGEVKKKVKIDNDDN
ncbi:hypothetical protein FHG64_18265 [Antarcticibacterium flavum]|uniref:Uncharacterized protein n=1 Tax=Antarcticibacterium flavum TaxID=2058175 RepID=A0A5B7X8W9_9FLAO|nr:MULTISPECIES: hypothetical protein [Antarcticibacterium]MCM4160674.1 hypothetical protein [Antarcticibacterium sp. W02-3]QCY71178.1 hypothetical protein FHG64_18265 [Antarcticibacterium flavum]